MARPKRGKIFTNAAVFILLEVASFYILAAGSDIQQMWVSRGFHNMSAGLWSGTEDIRHFIHLKQENERLAEDNMLLSRQIHALMRELGNSCATNRYVRDNFEIMPASIVSMTFGSQHNYLILDKGAENGVEIDDGVVTARGVVGIIKSVDDNYSYATSFANKDMVISARIGHEGSVGSMIWDGRDSNGAILDNIPIHNEVNMGDTVFTSGFSAMFPRDIPLGTVTGKTINNGSTAAFSLKLLEDYSALKHVLIVKNNDLGQITGLENE